VTKLTYFSPGRFELESWLALFCCYNQAGVALNKDYKANLMTLLNLTLEVGLKRKQVVLKNI
jgi:hypothetical protein